MFDRLQIVLGLLLGSLLTSSIAFGQSDECLNATPIGEGVFPFETLGATPTPSGPVPLELGADVWFLYTATQVGTVRFETCGAPGVLDDTLIVVYDAGLGCPGTTSGFLVFDDDGCFGPGGASSVEIDAAPGQEFLVQIGGRSPLVGDSVLFVSVSVGVENCNDGGDNDTDGLIDCEDPDCLGQAPCLDFDGDGILDFVDNCPEVFNPAQGDSDLNGIGDACEDHLILDQVDFYRSDLAGTPLLLDSDWGMYGITLPNLGPEHVYVNWELNGDWVIQNWRIHAVNFAVVAPFETRWVPAVVGPVGVDVTSANCRVTVTRAPLPGGVPPIVPSLAIPVGTMVHQIGSEGDSLDPADPPAPADPAVGTPSTTARPVTYTRSGANMVDLDETSERFSCAPGAVASSMVWLNRTYCLGLADGPSAKDDYLEELEEDMGTDLSSGTPYENIVPGKQEFIDTNELPLTIEGEGVGSPDTAADIEPASIFEEMRRGQDVELSYRWGDRVAGGDNDFNRSGHALWIIGMSMDEDGSFTITTLDDSNQRAAGGNDRVRTWEVVEDPDDAPAGWYVRDTGGRGGMVGWGAFGGVVTQRMKASAAW